MELLTLIAGALGEYAPIVSLVVSGAQEALGAGAPQGAGGWTYDALAALAALAGAEALGRLGARIAARTETAADDRFWARWLRGTRWLLALARRTPAAPPKQ